MTTIDSWYCILTNGVCIFPCFLLYRQSLWGDFILYLATGMASFMYHLNNLEVNFLNDVAIRNTDIILANLSVFHTVNLLCLYDTPTRWNYTVACLPLVIYTAEYGLDFTLCPNDSLQCGGYGVCCPSSYQLPYQVGSSCRGVYSRGVAVFQLRKRRRIWELWVVTRFSPCHGIYISLFIYKIY